MTDTNDHHDTEQGPKSIWDNDLPAGDSPPLPRWPMITSIVACVLWSIFLVAMLIQRLNYTPFSQS